KTVASGSYPEIKLWDVQTGALQRTLIGHQGSVYSIAFSPDGSTIVSGSNDDTIKFWNVRTGTLQRTVTQTNDTVYSVAFSPNGRTVVSGSYNKTVAL